MSHMKLFDGIAYCSVLDYLLVKHRVLKRIYHNADRTLNVIWLSDDSKN